MPADDGDATRPSGAAMRMTIPGTPMAVREGLLAIMESAMFLALPTDCRDTAQIVVAEVLNNIVEHAYADAPGTIDVAITRDAASLVFEFADQGAPLPNHQLPPGNLKPMDPAGDLPEGGFGWFLIRNLSQEVKYCRTGGRNRLSLRLPGEQTFA